MADKEQIVSNKNVYIHNYLHILAVTPWKLVVHLQMRMYMFLASTYIYTTHTHYTGILRR